MLFICVSAAGCLRALASERALCKTAEEISADEKIILYKNPAEYLLLLPGPVLILMVGIVKKKRFKMPLQILPLFATLAVIVLAGISSCINNGKIFTPENRGNFAKNIDDGIKFYKLDRFKEAKASFEKAASKKKIFPLLYYNKALCYNAENRSENALEELYSGLSYAPMDPTLLSEADSIENKQNLVQQYHPYGIIDPDIPFCIALIFFNCAIFFAGLRAMTKKDIFTLLLAFTVSVCVLSFLVFGYSIGASATTYGIVTSQSGLKKIPADNLAPWITLKPSVSFKVIGEALDYVLAENGSGFKGWIKKSEILIHIATE